MKKVALIVFVSVLVKVMYFALAHYLGYTEEGIDIGIFKRNDSFWYERIALEGHDRITPDQLGKCEEGNIEQSYYAFFPLYPFLIRAMIIVSKLSFDAVAFLLSILFSTALFVVFYQFLVRRYKSEKIALLASLFLIVLPFNYYFSVFYTEALFLFLLVGSFYSIEKRSTGFLLLLTCALVLVRPNGLFMLAPLFLYYIEKRHSLNIKVLIGTPRKQLVGLSVFLAPVFVFIVYCFYLNEMTGDFFAYKTAQAGWCRETVFPWMPILKANNWKDYFKVVYLASFALLTLINIKKMPMSFLLLIAISLLLPLVANSITSPRFISVVFVFPIIFARYTSKANRSMVFLLLVGLCMIQLYTFTFWLAGDEFSY